MDTNIYVGFKRGAANVIDALSRAETILVPATVVGELLCGFKCGDRLRANREELETFLDTPRVNLVGIDEETAEFYADIYRNLRRAGRPIPTNDMWIAASAMQHGAAVCTQDGHFRNVPGLMVEVP